ncbi:MAG: addiction module protein [Candidatus Didemnitutus sp.]|nr:addiction module protein [Candidatus Didemnitutus sp.]
MSTILPLDKMTIDQKLQALEELTIDLHRRGALEETPAWQDDILRERAQLVQEGKAEFVDLATFKKLVAEDIARGKPK